MGAANDAKDHPSQQTTPQKEPLVPRARMPYGLSKGNETVVVNLICVISGNKKIVWAEGSRNFKRGRGGGVEIRGRKYKQVLICTCKLILQNV